MEYNTMVLLNPEKVMFSDGLVNIFWYKSHSGCNGTKKKEILGDLLVIDGQYDDPVSLRRIENLYPWVKMVIYEEAMEGIIYRKTEDGWRVHGKTEGFA